MERNVVHLILVSVCLLVVNTLDVENNPSEYSDCPDDLFILQKALYGIKGNRQNLTKTFYPSRKPSTGFVRVNYYFLDEYGAKDEDCVANFLWVSGGFLLIQPPSVFRFTSLLFDNKVDDIQSVNLTLPFECRAITVNCSCVSDNDDDDDDLLDLLTQQLNLFAKYNDPTSIVREDSSTVQALCSNKLEKTYYESDFDRLQTFEPSVHFFLLFTILVPVICISVIIALVRSWRTEIHAKLTRPINYGNVSGVAITGFFLTFYVLILDAFAVHYSFKSSHELSDVLKTKYYFNFIVTIILLIYDAIVTIVSSSVLLYICFIEMNLFKSKKHFLKLFKFFFTTLFYIIFGKDKQSYSWGNQDGSQNQEPGNNQENQEHENNQENQEHENNQENQGDENDQENQGDENNQGNQGDENNQENQGDENNQGNQGDENNQENQGNENNQENQDHEDQLPSENNPSNQGHGVYEFDLDHDVINHNRLPWIVMFSSFAPIFSIAGHFSFILMSWLIDPSQATAIALVGIAVAVVFFIMTRQCYILNLNSKMENQCYDILCIPCYPLLDLLKILWFCCTHCCRECSCYQMIAEKCVSFFNWCIKKCKCDNSENQNEESIETVSRAYLAQELQPVTDYNFIIKEVNDQKSCLKLETNKYLFNGKAFCISFTWSLIFCGLITLAVFAFWELPVPTLALPTYLLNIFQVFIVVLSLLITYKIWSTNEPEIRRFLRSMRMSYTRGDNTRFDDKVQNYLKYDDIEAIGDLAGEAVYKYIHKQASKNERT